MKESRNSGHQKLSPAKFPRTELGNARRLVAVHGQDLRYCHQWDRWLVWDKTRWQLDNTGETIRRAKTVVDAMLQGVALLEGSERRELLKHVIASSQNRGLSAMVSLARSEGGIPVRPEDLDRDLDLLNCPNGTVDLRTGELRAHRREDMLTKCTAASYVADAPAPEWLAFLGSIFAGDAELIGFIQRYLGYSLSGRVEEHVLAVFHGNGANGKSTLIEAFMHALGPDYSTKGAPDLLVVKPGNVHPTERADLFGKRFIAAVETDEGKRLSEGLVKELTGGDTVKARRMYEDFWTFRPTWKIALCTNYKPTIRGTDYGIWRRVLLVPFTQTFDGVRQDRKLLGKLRAERDGILAWAVQGCLEWQKRGLGSAEAVDVATQAYKRDQDIVGGFFAGQCVFGARCWVRLKDLRAAYEEWAVDSGMPVLNPKRFASEIETHGGERFTNNGTCYRGIGLKQASAEVT